LLEDAERVVLVGDGQDEVAGGSSPGNFFKRIEDEIKTV
jgi:hypothetical protein